jgi:tripartite-type tricarboxylate transporter receptor subunit TctC
MGISRNLSAVLQVLLCCAIALCGAAGTRAHAKSGYPNRMVTIVVPAAPGSATDVIARIVGNELSKRWKQNVIVNNISGGGLNIGSKHVADSPPDGYTLLVAPPTPLTTADLVYRDLSYDPGKFVPISVLVRVPNVLVARNSLAVNSVQQLVAYAKANPGKLSYGSQGIGTTSQLSFKLLERLAGIEMVHVPYRGELPVLNDIIAGNIDLFFGTLSTTAPMYRAKQLKALAVGSLKRSPFLPDVPTVAEQGYPSFQSIAWFAMAGPPNRLLPTRSAAMSIASSKTRPFAPSLIISCSNQSGEPRRRLDNSSPRSARNGGRSLPRPACSRRPNEVLNP